MVFPFCQEAPASSRFGGCFGVTNGRDESQNSPTLNSKKAHSVRLFAKSCFVRLLRTD